ncbi:MAG: hypothetical protein IJA85_00915 [Clostridia bacterium]|nr:hypothetical protein [Clostridia bacterium]
MKEYLVGVNYFCGWWRDQPNKWTVPAGHDWRVDYPGRVPLLGCYNDQETMDYELAAAAESGVDYFAMLWYAEAGKREEKPSWALNRCFDLYRNSPNRGRVKYYLEFCNHPPYEIDSEELWQRSVEYFIDNMEDENCLHIFGRPVMKIHGLQHFYNQCDQNPDIIKGKIEYIRQRAAARGLGDIIILSGVMAQGINHIERELTAFIDGTNTYMDFGPLPRREEDYPYEELERLAAEGRINHANTSPVPYVPYVPAGWNPKPWGSNAPLFDLPNQSQWECALQNVKRALDENENLGFVVDGKRQKAFTIYAWNEFGEGGILAPTTGDRYMKLETLKKIFGEN